MNNPTTEEEIKIKKILGPEYQNCGPWYTNGAFGDNHLFLKFLEEGTDFYKIEIIVQNTRTFEIEIEATVSLNKVDIPNIGYAPFNLKSLLASLASLTKNQNKEEQ